jgi:hypothetical protein
VHLPFLLRDVDARSGSSSIRRHVKVKPEMITEYADLQKNEVIPALQKRA